MAKAIALFNGGIHELRQAAIREDGAVFRRWQVKDPRYGYRWSKWQATGEVLGENARANLDVMEAGFARLHRCKPNDANVNNAAWYDGRGELRVRLPD